MFTHKRWAAASFIAANMAKILVLNGHPHDSPDHYVPALATAYAHGAEDMHVVRRIDLAKLDFPVLRNPDDWKMGEVPTNLSEAQDAIEWADHLVIVYPLWLGDMPASLKAFLEQVMRPGFALGPHTGNIYRKLLKGKSARLIVTMGMPTTAYSLFYRAHSVKSFKRNILQFVGVSPVRVTLIGNVEKSDAYRKEWLQKVERMARFGR